MLVTTFNSTLCNFSIKMCTRITNVIVSRTFKSNHFKTIIFSKETTIFAFAKYFFSFSLSLSFFNRSNVNWLLYVLRKILLLAIAVFRRIARKFASDLRNADRDPIDISVSVSGSITVTFKQIYANRRQSLGANLPTSLQNSFLRFSQSVHYPKPRESKNSRSQIAEFSENHLFPFCVTSCFPVFSFRFFIFDK